MCSLTELSSIVFLCVCVPLCVFLSFHTLIDYIKAPIRVTRPCKFTDRSLQEPQGGWEAVCECVCACVRMFLWAFIHMQRQHFERSMKIVHHQFKEILYDRKKKSTCSWSYAPHVPLRTFHHNPSMQRLESTLSHLKSIAQSEKYARRRAWTRKRDERSRKRERERRFILKGTVLSGMSRV